MIKQVLALLGGGFIVGLAGSMWLGPGLIEWWYTPPGQQPAWAQCGGQIHSALGHFVVLQLIGGVLAAAIVLAAGLLFLRARARRAATAAAAATPAGGPAAPTA